MNSTSVYTSRAARMVRRLATMGIRHPQVLRAMHDVPRHLFVNEALRGRAYDDMSLPIGLGQTISQPYTVAKMTELLISGLRQPEKVLEIGTGCGYQTAVLARLGIPKIYSIERLRELHELAKINFRRSKVRQVRLSCGNGYLGRPNEAPFDGIIVTAAPKEVPAALLMQLKENGRLVLPLDEGYKQYLWLIEKTAYGYHETCIQEANFVPLIGDGA